MIRSGILLHKMLKTKNICFSNMISEKNKSLYSYDFINDKIYHNQNYYAFYHFCNFIQESILISQFMNDNIYVSFFEKGSKHIYIIINNNNNIHINFNENFDYDIIQSDKYCKINKIQQKSKILFPSKSITTIVAKSYSGILMS